MSPVDCSSPSHRAQAGDLLRELGFAAHRVGYQQLCIAIPCYAQDATQSLVKEIYPCIAKRFGYTNWCAVEHAIRCSIHDAWQARDPAVWAARFPNCRRPPSNKRFIATLAQCLEP